MKLVSIKVRGMAQWSILSVLLYYCTTIADNYCFNGLITLKGMEKESWIFSNNIQRNDGVFMVNVDMDSHSEILGFIEAYLTQNVIQVLSLTLAKF